MLLRANHVYFLWVEFLRLIFFFCEKLAYFTEKSIFKSEIILLKKIYMVDGRQLGSYMRTEILICYRKLNSERSFKVKIGFIG